MRLSSEQIGAIQRKAEFEVLPGGHPSQSELEEAFGSHTFLLNDDGLLILEADSQPCEHSPKARLKLLATWDDEAFSKLLVQSPPLATDVVIDLNTGDATERP